MVQEQGCTHGPCEHCLEKLDLKLLHPPEFCPLRERAIELYNSGDVRPSGVFYKYLKQKGLLKRHNQKPPQAQCNLIRMTSSDFTGNHSGTWNNLPRKQVRLTSLFSTGNNQAKISKGMSKAQCNMIKLASFISQNKIIDDPKVMAVGSQARCKSRKLYLTFRIGKVNVKQTANCTALFDSGSDLNLISRSYLCKLLDIEFENIKDHLQQADVNLTSYTNHHIELSGIILKLKYREKK